MSGVLLFSLSLFLFKQKTAYEMRISDWSSDVCSSDLVDGDADALAADLRSTLRTHDAVLQRSDQVVALLIGGGEDTVRALRQRLEQSFPTLAAQIGSASCRERVCQYV